MCKRRLMVRGPAWSKPDKTSKGPRCKAVRRTGGERHNSECSSLQSGWEPITTRPLCLTGEPPHTRPVVQARRCCHSFKADGGDDISAVPEDLTWITLGKAFQWGMSQHALHLSLSDVSEMRRVFGWMNSATVTCCVDSANISIQKEKSEKSPT